MQQLFNKVFQFYVFSNLHVAIAVFCYVCVGGILFEKNVDNEAFFLGMSSFVAYHMIRFLNRTKYGKVHLLDDFSNKYKKIIFALVLLAIISSFYFLTQFYFLQFLQLIPIVLLTLLYAFSVFKINGKTYSIRYFPGLKIFIIGISWAGAIVVFPLGHTFNVVLYFLEVLCFVVVLTIPFDIRDVDFDRDTVKTLPLLIGVNATKVVGTFLLLLSMAFHVVLFNGVFFKTYLFVCFVLLVLLWKSTTKQPKYYASFWVEALPILYLLVLKSIV